MLHGLHIVISAKELAGRIESRIRAHEARGRELGGMLAQQSSDSPYIFVEDRCKSVDEVKTMWEACAARAEGLTVVRNHLAEDETYTLSLADLHAMDLLRADVVGTLRSDRNHGLAGADEAAPPPTREKPAERRRGPRIDGLKLKMAGVELRDLLTDAAKARLRLADHWKREAASAPAETEKKDKSQLPGRLCEKEAERQEWRAEVLTFLKSHVDETATYWLGRDDLEFGDLLPEDPDWLGECSFGEESVLT